jgi:hypothetical protein
MTHQNLDVELAPASFLDFEGVLRDFPHRVGKGGVEVEHHLQPSYGLIWCGGYLAMMTCNTPHPSARHFNCQEQVDPPCGMIPRGQFSSIPRNYSLGKSTDSHEESRKPELMRGAS